MLQVQAFSACRGLAHTTHTAHIIMASHMQQI